ncbi:hypothetical protein PIB30_084063 [Stylosanthes scabra]|uniref:Uncharacterized protein n=1 Tax=Stylosanthes scabra TaxID=79078 RepID=A0ABU6XV28_9FABA|nr:hypothetical protein [Stylosanthes scabra]
MVVIRPEWLMFVAGGKEEDCERKTRTGANFDVGWPLKRRLQRREDDLDGRRWEAAMRRAEAEAMLGKLREMIWSDWTALLHEGEADPDRDLSLSHSLSSDYREPAPEPGPTNCRRGDTAWTLRQVDADDAMSNIGSKDRGDEALSLSHYSPSCLDSISFLRFAYDIL